MRWTLFLQLLVCFLSNQFWSLLRAKLWWRHNLSISPGGQIVFRPLASVPDRRHNPIGNVIAPNFICSDDAGFKDKYRDRNSSSFHRHNHWTFQIKWYITEMFRKLSHSLAIIHVPNSSGANYNMPKRYAQHCLGDQGYLWNNYSIVTNNWKWKWSRNEQPYLIKCIARILIDLVVWLRCGLTRIRPHSSALKNTPTHWKWTDSHLYLTLSVEYVFLLLLLTPN